MALLGNLPVQTSFIYCNSSNQSCLVKPCDLCFTPPRLHTLRPITRKIVKQWACVRLEIVKPIDNILGSPKPDGLQEMGNPHEGLNLQAKEDETLPAKKQKKVSVFWDLDNKPPKVAPYDAAIAVRELAVKFGEVVDLAAFANRHAFTHVPQRIVKERRERRKVDFMESKGLIKPEEPYVCGVCGRKCKTNVDLKKHFKQLHERERQKKMSRLNSLKGKRKAKFREQFRAKDEKYQNAARDLLFPKVGYGLASELRRAGVFVKTVEDKPQSADAALKRQIRHSLSRGIDYVFLISDDSDFSHMLDKVRKNNMRTVVLGDSRALIRHADLWLSWDEVTSGMGWDAIDNIVHKWSVEDAVLDQILDLQDTRIDEGYRYDSDESESDSGIDRIAEEIVKDEGRVGQVSRVSAFSEEDQQWQAEGATGNLEGHYYDEDDWDSVDDEDMDREE